MEGLLTISERNAIRELQQKMQEIDKYLMRSFEAMHGGYLEWTLLRFLKAREFNVPKAYQMLTDSLRWRMKEDVDNILQRDLTEEVLKRVRHGSLISFRGYCNKGRPIFAYALGLSDFVGATVEEHVAAHIQLNEYRDRVILPEASARMGRPIVSCIKVLDTSGLKMSALSKLKIVTAIASIDDLNYPEKTDTYYIVNTPYVFSTCWKVVKNLLQERTRHKVKVLHGNGHDELLKVMDESCLPPFATRRSSHVIDPCYTLSDPFYQAMQKFVQTRADEAKKSISGCSAEVVKADCTDEGALNYW